MPVLATRNPIKVIVHAEHRNGICEGCGIQMEARDIDIGGGKIRKQMICPECSGGKGQLIAITASVQAPVAPDCISPKCLLKFIYDSLFVAFLSSYHFRRVAYAEKNRPDKGKKILERYRTGEPSPKNLWQAIHANFKLACPICRKYNLDPFLFGGNRH